MHRLPCHRRGRALSRRCSPLNQCFPACFKEARKIADRAIQAGIRVVNPPQALSNTVKSSATRSDVGPTICDMVITTFAVIDCQMCCEGLSYERDRFS